MKKTFLTLLLLTATLTGCVVAQPTPTGFYWGNYSRDLYSYRKDPSPATLARFKTTLEKIIKEADINSSRRVPPGVYAELGKIYLEEGDKEKALQLFEQEATHFPESSVLMSSLMEKART